MEETEKNKLLDAVGKGKAYAHLNKVSIRYRREEAEFYVFPRNNDNLKTVKERMLQLFDFGTVYQQEKTIFVSPEVKCPNEIKRQLVGDIQDTFVINCAKIQPITKICRSCKHSV